MTTGGPADASGGRGLLWRDLSAAVPGGRALLRAHSGGVGAGRLLGVLGPSGAGKSTLFAALAGTLRGTVRGEVWAADTVPARCAGGRDTVQLAAVGVALGTAALLEQEDAFFSELTVRETLVFAARLAGRPRVPAQRDAEALLRRVGLAAVADQRVGDGRHAGAAGFGPRLSGGERRRLAVACALAGEGDACARGKAGASAPKILLADEPTTGLDAFQAERVVALLKDLSELRRCATMVTLHQPRASIWSKLDDVLLMAPDGYVVYCGCAAEALDHFCALQHPCPAQGMNPAEFLIDIVSIDSEDSSQASRSQERIVGFAAAFRGHPPQLRGLPSLQWDLERGLAGARVARPLAPGASSPWITFGLLFCRSCRQNFRDRATNAVRLLASGGLALVFGAHFGVLDGGGLPSARSVATRICVMSFGVIAMAMLATARALDRFSKESGVVGRERAAGAYGGCVYLAAKALTELPTDAAFGGLFAAVVHRQCGLHADLARVVATMSLVATCCAALGLAIGAAAPKGERAMAIGAPIMVVHMLTGVIDPAGTAAQQPSPLMQLLRSFSPIRHAIEALCISELGGMRLARSALDAPRMGGLALVSTGDEVLRRLDIQSTFDGNLQRIAALTAVHLLAALACLAAGHRGPRRRAGIK